MRVFIRGTIMAIGPLLSASLAWSNPAQPIDAPKIIAEVVGKCNNSFSSNFSQSSLLPAARMQLSVEDCSTAADIAFDPLLTRAQLAVIYPTLNQEVARFTGRIGCTLAISSDVRCQLAQRLTGALLLALTRKPTDANANLQIPFLTYTAAALDNPAWFGTGTEAVSLDPLEKAAAAAENKAEISELVGLFMTARAAEQIYNSVSLREDSIKLRARAQRWDAYHFGDGDVRTPLPWELAINGALFASHNREAIRTRGYDLEPPTWALTIAHPSIGVAPFTSSGAPSGVNGVIEWLGYSRWDYGGPNGNRTNEWGLSLVSVYQPVVGARDWSPGILFRTPFRGINVVLSDPDIPGSDGDPVISFSVDLQKVFGFSRQSSAAQ
jgi:hypothetical protein